MPGTITLLAVEDNDDDAHPKASAFVQGKNCTYELLCVRSLTAFLKQASQTNPDIVLLDLQLPDGTSDFYQAIRAAAHFTAAVEAPAALRDASCVSVKVGANQDLSLWSVDGTNSETLLSAVDARMYLSKSDREQARRAG